MIHTAPRIVRRRARDEVSALLRKMILTGELAGEARLEEVELSARIGLSRTPIREALITLEAEGLVQSRPNKGFVVVRADAAMVRQTYPILGALEAEALRLSGPRLKPILSELVEMNRRLGQTRDKQRQYELDHGLHARLTEGCGNQRLLDLLAVERRRARRFDGAQARGTADREGSCRDHQAILGAIEADRCDDAARLMRAHWDRGTEVVITWLERQD